MSEQTETRTDTAAAESVKPARGRARSAAGDAADADATPRAAEAAEVAEFAFVVHNGDWSVVRVWRSKNGALNDAFDNGPGLSVVPLKPGDDARKVAAARENGKA